MYLIRAEIHHIKSISHWVMDFDQPAGWHVLIGDNGSGKTTILRALAIGLMGKENSMGLRPNWKDWISKGKNYGNVDFKLKFHSDDFNDSEADLAKQEFTKRLQLSISGAQESFVPAYGELSANRFSAAFGPFRRFEGGNPEWRRVFDALPTLGAHLSLFGEDVALTEALDWLVKLNYKSLENHPDSFQLDCIKALMNSPDFLPNGLRLKNINSEGVTFGYGNGSPLEVSVLSDGYRSILCLTFELIRQLVRVYGPHQVFQRVRKGEMNIDLPGVVLIDEIDVHLHPSWQVRIGDWFTKYFPNIQFIVTTHSPLICRASERGSIWRLAAPGSNEPSGRISKLDADRIVYGNILDAYGTELFGSATVRSQKSGEKLERLGQLNVIAALGKLTADEEKERLELQQIFTTDDPFGQP